MKPPPRLTLVQPPIVAGRVPPHDLDAEAAVISSAILKPTTIDDVRDLTRAQFYSESNGEIFDAIVAEYDATGAVDIVTVASRLRSKERLAAVGGAGYIAQLCDATPAVANVAEHAAIVARKARMRLVIAECQMISAEGYGDVGDEDAWIEQASDRLRIAEREAHEATHIHAAMQRTWSERQSGRMARGPSTSLADVDAKIGGLRPGKVQIVGARSYVGKTAYALQVAGAVAMAGHGVLVFELEALEDETTDRTVNAVAGVDCSPLLAGARMPAEDMTKISGAMESLSKTPFFMVARSGQTMTSMRATARKVRRQLAKRGIKLALVVIDYVQLVPTWDMPDVKGQSREAQVAAVSRATKALAMDLDVHVMMLAQLNANMDRRGEDTRPRTGDMRECSAIEMDADHIVLLHNEHRLARSRGERDGFAHDEVELILGKNRGGKPGTIHARWVPSMQRFVCGVASEPADGYYGDET